MIAHARLAGLVAEEAGDDAVLHVAAHAGDDVLLGAQHHVAVGRAHDDHHPAGLDDGRRRHGDVGVHVGDGDRGARLADRSSAAASAVSPPAFCAQLADLARHLVVDQMFQPGVERLEEVVGREAVALRPDALVAGGREVARLVAGELPDDPVGGLDQPVGGRVDLRVLVQDLPGLGHEPLGADLAAVAVQERIPALAGDLVELVGLGLGRVMLPQLDPGVRPAAVLGQEAERRAVRLGRAASCRP